MPVHSVFDPSSGFAAIRTVGVAGDVVAGVAGSTAKAVVEMERVVHDLGVAVKRIGLAELIAAADPPTLDLLAGEAARSNADIAAHPSLDPTLKRRLEKGWALTETQLDEARKRLRQLAEAEVRQLFAGVDAVLLPVMPDPTPTVAACDPLAPGFSGRTLYRLSGLARFVNGLGLPAVAVPAGFDQHGMPIALQLVGPKGSDRALLELSLKIQSVTTWHRRAPTHLRRIKGDFT